MLFDHDDSGLLFPISDSMDSDLMLRASDQMAMELDADEIHMTSVWTPSDCYFDPEDPYNPCGPHHGGPDRDFEIGD